MKSLVRDLANIWKCLEYGILFSLGTKKANSADLSENIPKVKHDDGSIILWGCV